MALLAMGLIVHGGAVGARLVLPEPLAGEESLALARGAVAVPAYLGPPHAQILLLAPPWLPGLRLLLGILPLLASALLIEWSGRRLLGVPWTGIAWGGLTLLLWPPLGPIDATSATPLLVLAALGAWAATAVESRPGVRAPLASMAIVAAMMLHPAGIALLGLPFLLAREDRRHGVAGALALLATAGLAGAGQLPHVLAAAHALLEPDATGRMAAALPVVLPLALPGLAAPFLLARLEQAGPRDPEWSLAATVGLLALGGLASTPLLGPDALTAAALVGLAAMALLLGGLAMGRAEAPLRTAALAATLLVAGILFADLPGRREASRPPPADAAWRLSTLGIQADLTDLHAPGLPPPGARPLSNATTDGAARASADARR
jgi:hypothetical protein